MHRPYDRGLPRAFAPLAGLAVILLLLAACTSASPAASEPAGSEPAASEPAASEPAASEAEASEPAAAACEVSDATSGDATVTIASSSFGDDITISAGQAVAFVNNDGVGHTVTQGENGLAADGACVDEAIAAGATLVVVFNDPGDYPITCEIHSSMNFVVHVE